MFKSHHVTLVNKILSPDSLSTNWNSSFGYALESIFASNKRFAVLSYTNFSPMTIDRKIDI